MYRSHLVGSVNLPSAEAVFTMAAREMGADLGRIPDGETDRPFVVWMLPKVMAHPGLESQDGGTIAGVVPRLTIRPSFAGRLDFDDFGFAPAACNSYAVFTDLKRQNLIRPETRFQISIPSPTTVAVALCQGSDQKVLANALERAFLREVATIARDIPHEQLAIQWDMPGEICSLEGFFNAWFGKDLDPIVAGAKRLAAAVPQNVELGFHLCYGDPPPAEGARGRHLIEPKDTAVLVAVANAIADGVERSIEWFHIPVPIRRDDADYFRPLGALRLGAKTDLFLGLIHDADGVDGAKRRIAAARPFRADFGVATECGMGRIPREEIPPLLKLQAEVAAGLE